MTQLDLALARARVAYTKALDRTLLIPAATPAWWAAEARAQRARRELARIEARVLRVAAEERGERWLRVVDGQKSGGEA